MIEMDKPFQRKGSKSNADVGRRFEKVIQSYFSANGNSLHSSIKIPIGINGTKPHSFDLGSADEKILVECKSHTWTESDGVPHGKLTIWDKEMFFFHMAPPEYRKILMVLKSFSPKRGKTLAQYYVSTHFYLIPNDVEIWEYDEKRNVAVQIK